MVRAATVSGMRGHVMAPPFPLSNRAADVLQRKVISVHPPENRSCDETAQIVTTKFKSFQHELTFSILWMGRKKGKGKNDVADDNEKQDI
ncbi:hypothetical protein PoB_003194000 [Plakobranchus ocellatus]|uniref:Uncharacterized protein n=1 Tax=Plakobranchus ocellatus TaxID=259542 RepID=A0AAV4ADK0_9GAST|nr:hypothetical protein PoB_003194000 [Plakobranchus ocellatus]